MDDRDTERDDGGYGAEALGALFDRGEVQGVLAGSFYAQDATPPKRKSRSGPPPSSATHYKVICISLYNDDLEALDQKVEELKKRGLTKANRSALIRHALASVDLDKVPRGL